MMQSLSLRPLSRKTLSSLLALLNHMYTWASDSRARPLTACALPPHILCGLFFAANLFALSGIAGLRFQLDFSARKTAHGAWTPARLSTVWMHFFDAQYCLDTLLGHTSPEGHRCKRASRIRLSDRPSDGRDISLLPLVPLCKRRD